MNLSHVRSDGVAVFHYPDPHHGSVHVTGSFCGWQVPGVPLERTASGWGAEVGPVPDGDVTYKLIVDGRWVTDPVNLTKAPDGRGGHNSLLPRDGVRGSTYHLRFHSPALGEPRGYALYLPGGYFDGDARYPMIELLHGALDWELTWLDKGELAGTLDGLRRDGAVGPMIVVMPKEPGDLYRGDGRVLDYLARDVVGHADFEYRTLASPRHRALDGLSTGGFTSLALGALRPEVHGAIGSMSGSYDGRLAQTVSDRAGAMRAAGQRYLLSCGHDEPHFAECRAMADLLRAQGVPTEWLDAPGSHDWPVWRALLAAHLRFHWAQIRP